MVLIIQIKSLIFSFFFGIILYFIINSCEKFLYGNKKVYNILSAFLISILSCLLYFILIKKINNGIIHLYFVLVIILGYFICYKLKLWNHFFKKWYFWHLVYNITNFYHLHLYN